jgi:SAM-dependent methyltransferase
MWIPRSSVKLHPGQPDPGARANVADRTPLAPGRALRKSFSVTPSLAPPRAPGQVPTPGRLARKVAAELLDAAPTIRSFLDPACGAGALLLALVAEWRTRGREGELELTGWDLDSRMLAQARAALEAESGGRLRLHLERRDALARGARWPTGAAIAANPPWASYSGRQGIAAPRARSAGGWPSVHGDFAERIARHCAEHAVPALVLLPAAWCELERYAPSRARVDALDRISWAFEVLGEGTFPGVIGSAALVRLRPEARGPRPGEPDLLRALRRHLSDLHAWPSACFGDVGVHTGNAAAELIDRAPARPDLREGRDLAPFRLAPPRLALRSDVERSPARRFRTGTLDGARGWSVLLRQTAHEPIAAVHEPAAWFRNSLLACRPPADVSPDCAVALLNGPLAVVFHQLAHADARQRAFPQLKIAHLRAQRFPFANRAAAPALHDELARRALALRRHASAIDAAWERERAALAELTTTVYCMPESLAHAVRRALVDRVVR